jgi:UDP-hydrolysing UDP-N-acetyl-D-glucosamine 2-epimerase
MEHDRMTPARRSPAPARCSRRAAGRGARTKRIAVVTGSRAEYGLLRSVIAAIDRHPRLELQLVLTGMHLLRRFGGTAHDIERDGWPIAARVPMQRGDDSPGDQAEGLARGIAGLSRVFNRSKPDIVLVLGDRIEALAGALAAVTTDRILAHIHGGDVAPGDLDDAFRDAITRLSHVHLVATRSAARRVIRMGEEPRRVFLCGAPGLDDLTDLLRRRAPRQRNARTSSSRPEAIIVQHAYGRPADIEYAAARAVFDAVADEGLARRIVYPNSDRGHSGVIRAIREHANGSTNGDVRVERSLPRDAFLRALLEARILAGNSSCGLIEAPFAGVPVVNVGDRQLGREPGGPAVFHAHESRTAVRAALRRALRARPAAGRRTVYGDGRSGRRIARILAKIALTRELRRKRVRP